MRVDLHNFFLHYDPKNPKHVAAVEQLEVDLAGKEPDLLEDDLTGLEYSEPKLKQLFQEF